MLLAIFAAPASAFEMTQPYLLRAAEAGEQRFGGTLVAAGPLPGAVGLVFEGPDTLTLVAVADEPCGGADCLAEARVVALGTAGGQGVETVVLWEDGQGRPLGESVLWGSAAHGLVGWLGPQGAAGCARFSGTETEFHGTETEFHGTETELTCAASGREQALAAFVGLHAAVAPEPRASAAVAALAGWWFDLHLDG